MLIKSNFKDYYDYLAGEYGIDNKAIYERVQTSNRYSKEWVKGGQSPFLYVNDFEKYIIAFCGTLYYVILYKGRFYYGNNYKQLPDDVIKKHRLNEYYFSNDKRTETEIFHLSKTDINEKENCPIMLVKRQGFNDDIVSWFMNPKLSEFRFATIVSAHEAWLQLNNFLLREKVVETKMTDIDKVISHGFDKKTSFRNM